MGEIGETEGHSSASATNGKCRNKRKCLSDLAFHLQEQPPLMSLTEFPRYELLGKQLAIAFKQLGLTFEKSRDINKDEKVEKLNVYAEWDNPIAFELEEILCSFLSTAFANAIRKLVGCGYTEETAEWAILSSSKFNGSKDAEFSIVEGALALLKMNEHVKIPKKPVFESLHSLVEYTLLEMIHVVRELRPELSMTEVMWCLLVNDLDLATTCGLISGPETPWEPSGTGQPNSAKSGALKPGDPRAQIFCPETPTIGLAQYRKPDAGGLQKEAPISLHELRARFSVIADMDEKPGGGSSKKVSALHCKRDLLRQKAVHFEKNYRGRLTKGSFKAKVAAAWESMILDQSLKSQSEVAMMENYSRLTISEREEHNGGNPQQLADKDSIPDLPKEPTENYYAQIPFDNIFQEYVANDEKDQLLLMIVSLKRELQWWYDWTNEKVMQATQKLGREQAELKTLRQEREDNEKSKKEKQTVEESTLKRLAEMDHAIANATGQIELANYTVRRLEAENNVLTREMEDARMEACGSLVKLEETVAKEQEMMKKMQAWEIEKGLMIEKLTCMRQENAELGSRIGKANDRHNQFKILWSQEEKERLKAESLIDSLMAKREKEEALTSAKADSINQTAETNKQKFEDDMKRLRCLISKLKLESGEKNVAALNVPNGPSNANDWAVFQECVMCMTEEMSVVFVPCGHQVLCGPCNALHEKHGMKDCPSCRATIQNRVTVSFRK